MSKSKISFFKHFDFLVLDMLSLQVSYYLTTLWYRHQFARGIGSDYYWSIACVLLLSNLFLDLGTLPYKNILKRDKFAEMKQVLLYALKGLIINIVLLYALHIAGNTSRVTTFVSWGVFFVVGYVVRVVWKRVLRQKLLHDRKDASTHVVVLTRRIYAERVIHNVQVNAFAKRKITGLFITDYDPEKDNQEIAGFKVLGDKKAMIDYITHNLVDEVLLCLPSERELVESVSSEVLKMGITVNTVLLEIDPAEESPMYVQKYGNYIVAVRKLRTIPLLQWALKRTIDICGSLVGLFFTAIVFVFVAPQIYIASPGPIFFAQNRVGKNGRVFKMYKFRSMYMDAEERKKELMKHNEMNGLMFKMKDDPRIIGSEKKDKNGNPKGIGNFIRKTSLDEFPQFFNVLKGDMSLVGTRPPTVDEWQQYSEAHRKRLAMRPGITGMWQVSGRSDITDFDEVVRLDSEYIDHWNVFMDIKILFMTVGQVLGHKGAE